jgi:arabinogalactan endo-1,4-beta-galactosidase
MEVVKIYSIEISDMIYNFQPEAWKYLDYEQQRAIMAFKKKVLELIEKETK